MHHRRAQNTQTTCAVAPIFVLKMLSRVERFPAEPIVERIVIVFNTANKRVKVGLILVKQHGEQ